jgi:polysaccharide pyruvyl transferase WcaK-like protein
MTADLKCLQIYLDDVRENMRKNIILFGLQFDSNLGDNAIFQCTRYMVENIIQEQDKSEIEIREVDMMGRAFVGDKVKRRFCFRVIHKLCNLFGNAKDRKIKTIEIKSICRDLCSYCIDSDTCAIIFAGGGLIKYRHQFLQEYLYNIIAYADKRNIPVMLSAVGVEGYEEYNIDCIKLKNAINKQCVKSITTRDDITLLQKFYVSKTMVTAHVADPACIINDLFPNKTEFTKETKVIGLNCVRENLFIEYGVEFYKQQMLELWSELFHKISHMGYECKIFCNGSPADERFGSALMDYMNITKEDRQRILLTRPETTEELVHIITSFDAVVACRLHASIIAYAYGVPSVGLVWNDKQKFFGEAIGYPERFILRKNFRADYVVSQLENAIEDGYSCISKEEFCDTTKFYLEKFIQKYLK